MRTPTRKTKVVSLAIPEEDGKRLQRNLKRFPAWRLVVWKLCLETARFESLGTESSSHEKDAPDLDRTESSSENQCATALTGEISAQISAAVDAGNNPANLSPPRVDSPRSNQLHAGHPSRPLSGKTGIPLFFSHLENIVVAT